MVTSVSRPTSDRTSLQQRWDRSVQHLVTDLTSALFIGSTTNNAVTPININASHHAITLISKSWYNKLFHLYSESHRAYHNWTHVQDVISSLDFLIDNIQQRRQQQQPTSTSAEVTEQNVAVLTLAAFFHDAIYNPKSSTNEQDSADLFVQFVRELYHGIIKSPGLSSKEQDDNSNTITTTTTTNSDSTNSSNTNINNSKVDIETKSTISSKVIKCILATQTHITSSLQAHQSNDTITALFLDADMSILGKSAKVYDRYASCIRREYQFVERAMYCLKRAEILIGFLPDEDDDKSNISSATRDDVTHDDNNNNNNNNNDDTATPSKAKHDFIYATEWGRFKWEENARCNLKREIESLQNGIIPCEPK